MCGIHNVLEYMQDISRMVLQLQVEVEAKDDQLQQKDDQLQQKDEEIQQKATELRERDTQINRQQRELQTLGVRKREKKSCTMFVYMIISLMIGRQRKVASEG